MYELNLLLRHLWKFQALISWVVFLTATVKFLILNLFNHDYKIKSNLSYNLLSFTFLYICLSIHTNILFKLFELVSICGCRWNCSCLKELRLSSRHPVPFSSPWIPVMRAGPNSLTTWRPFSDLWQWWCPIMHWSLKFPFSRMDSPMLEIWQRRLSWLLSCRPSSWVRRFSTFVLCCLCCWKWMIEFIRILMLLTY